jgi:anaerobic magnesium-protoporphyrin IX monomethyl ester cyclase
MACEPAEDRPDIVIIQQYPMTYFGVLALDAHLRVAGLRMESLIDALEPDIIDSIRALSPKIIGFSVFSTEHAWLVATASRIRKAYPGTKMIVGGVHAMVFPEKILADSDVDLVCIGDGETVLVDVINELNKESPSWSSINGIAYKSDKVNIVKTKPAVLSQYNDNIVEERNVYYERYPALTRDAVCYFISGRGCPYSCSFCYNSYLRNSIGNKGYLRRKSPEAFLKEILLTIRKVNVTSLFFIDDLFTFDKAWLKIFLPRFKHQVGLPFVCTTRANVLDDETAEMLSESGCHSVSFGIETGNEKLRRTVLNKDISNEEMIKCSNILRTNGITVRSSSMFCIPDETLDNALETVALNIQCKVDLAASMLLIPYPETKICNYIKSKGMLPEAYSVRDIPALAYKESVLNIADKKKIINTHYLLFHFVKYPWLFNKCKWLIHIESLNSLFYIIFIIGCFVRNRQENRLTWRKALNYAWNKRSLMH